VSVYPYPGPGAELGKRVAADREREAERRAHDGHLADEIRPPWWKRLARRLERSK